MEIGAFDSGQSVGYGSFFLALDEETFVDEQQAAAVSGRVSADGTARFTFPGETFIDTLADSPSGEVSSEATVRLMPLGNSGAFLTRILFSETEYALNDNNAIDLTQPLSREAGRYYGMAMKRAPDEASADMGGRYGSIIFTLAADAGGDQTAEGILVVTDLDIAEGANTSAASANIFRNNGLIEARNDTSVSPEDVRRIFSVGASNTLTITEAASLDEGDMIGDTQGFVLGDGSAYVVTESRGDFTAPEGERSFGGLGIEIGFRLGETAPDLAGASFRMQTMQYELGAANDLRNAFSLVESIGSGTLTVPAGGMVPGALLRLSDLSVDGVERNNDAAPLIISNETEQGSLCVISFDAQTSLFTLANDCNPEDPQNVLHGFVTEGGQGIGFYTFEQGEDFALTGIVFGDRTDD